MKRVDTIAGSFDRKRTQSLRDAYDKAVREGRTTFTWEEQEYLTDFSYYLLLFLAPVFEMNNPSRVNASK